MVNKYNCGYFFAPILSYEVYLLLSFISLFIFTSVFLFSLKNKGKLSIIGFSLVLLGGGANFLERIFNNGCVHDYLNFFNIFAFNVYDLMVNLGLIMFIVSFVRNNDDEQKNRVKKNI